MRINCIVVKFLDPTDLMQDCSLSVFSLLAQSPSSLWVSRITWTHGYKISICHAIRWPRRGSIGSCCESTQWEQYQGFSVPCISWAMIAWIQGGRILSRMHVSRNMTMLYLYIYWAQMHVSTIILVTECNDGYAVLSSSLPYAIFIAYIYVFMFSISCPDSVLFRRIWAVREIGWSKMRPHSWIHEYQK